MVTEMSLQQLSNASWSVLVKTIAIGKNRHMAIALERRDFHDKMFKSIDDSEIKVIKHFQQKNFLPL